MSVPALLAMRKKKDIMEWRVQRIEMTDPLETATVLRSLETENNLSVLIYVLLSTPRYDGGNLISSG